MNISLFIAKKYFLSRKKQNFINVISIISMLVVGIATMALIIVLSVFNGLEGLLRTLYDDFDPEIVITASLGKSFVYNEEIKSSLQKVDGIDLITEVIEDNVLIKYKNAQRVKKMKGVSENFLLQDRISKSIVSGDPVLKDGDVNYAIIGRGVQYDLSINPNNDFYTIQIYYPNNITPGSIDASRLYTVRHIMPSAVFAIEKYIDENYVFVPLDFASSLLKYGNKRTSLEVSLKENYSLQEVKETLTNILGNQFIVKSRDELHADLYKILQWEKLFVFITFSLIIGIASINIYFSLTMLVIDKKRDIAILSSQGASTKIIRNIFLFEGILISFSGAFIGLIFGLVISYLQQYFGLISMGMQTTLMDAYPVKVEGIDVVMTGLCIVLITILASIHPAQLSMKKIALREL